MERGPLPPSSLPAPEPAPAQALAGPSVANAHPGEHPMDLRKFLDVLRRRKWVVLACITLIPIATYFASLNFPKSYEATVVLQVQASTIDTSLFDTNGGQVTPQQSAVVTATAKLAQTPALAAKAALQLGDNPPTPSSLLSNTSVETDETSGFVTIHAVDGNPARSADIANAFAQALVVARARQARTQIQRTIDAIMPQINSLKRSDPARQQLSAQVQRLRAVEAAQGENARILAPALIPRSPASPRPIRDAVLALVVALLFSVVLAFGLERLNRRIRSPYDFEELTGAPLLGTVPASAFHGRDPAFTHEAFQMIRATLVSFNKQQRIKTILVTSPGVGEGKTTVAVNLALSLARSGKRVIVVDCDLRRPQVASRLNLKHAGHGLAEILTKESPLHTDLVEVSEEPNLRVLPAGVPPPNPSDLLNSSRMRDLLYFLAAKADFVVLDSTPLLRVSDAIPLLPQASGVVGLARVDQTRRDDIRRFQEVVTLSGGRLLGIIASGVRAERDSYGYGYGYGAGAIPPQPGAVSPSRNGAWGDGEPARRRPVEQEV